MHHSDISDVKFLIPIILSELFFPIIFVVLNYFLLFKYTQTFIGAM